MARATEADVREIIDTDLTDDQITPFLNGADVLVTQVCASAGYSAELLREITRYLAAHLVAVRDPRVKSETIGDATTSYHGQSGVGLDASPYGQQVRIFDVSGRFAALEKTSGPASIEAIA